MNEQDITETQTEKEQQLQTEQSNQQTEISEQTEQKSQFDQWKEENDNLRHEIFNLQKFNVKKMLSLNCTTQRFKHEILKADKHEECKEFDREIEHNNIFKEIKKLRYKRKFLEELVQNKSQIMEKINSNKENKNAQLIQKCQRLNQQIQKTTDELADAFEEFKQNQISTYEELNNDEEQISEDLNKLYVKIQHIENLNKNIANSTVDFSSGNTKNFQPLKSLVQVEEENMDEEQLKQREKEVEDYYYEENEFEEQQQANQEQQQDEEEENQNQPQWENVGGKLGQKLKFIQDIGDIGNNDENNDNNNNNNDDDSLEKMPNLGQNIHKNNDSEKNEDELEDSIDQIIKNDKLYEEELRKQKMQELEEKHYQTSEQKEQEQLPPQPRQIKKQRSFISRKMSASKSERKSRISETDIKSLNEFEQDEEIKEGTIQYINQQMEKTKNRMQQIEEDIVKNGGKNCGWKAKDHDEFIQIKNKHGNKIKTDEFWDEYRKFMAFFEEDELKEHLDRYASYVQMDQEKKQLIQEYKQLTLQKKGKEKEEQNNLQKRKQERQRSLRQKDIIQRETDKQRIQEWRQRKKDAQLEHDDQQQLLEFKKKQLQKEEKVKQQHKLQKQMVKEYQAMKQFKQIQEQKRILEQKSQKKPPISYETKLRIKQKEEQHFTKQMEKVWGKKYEKEDEELRKQYLMELNNKKYEQVPSKLRDTTAASENKQAQKFSYEQSRFDQKGENFAGYGVRQTGKRLTNY